MWREFQRLDVIDHFARLGIARAPWLDPEPLKERFLALSAEVHPDKASMEREKAEADFQRLNESYRVLSNSRARLLHLLEWEGMGKPEHVQVIPAIALDLFSSIADLTRCSDALLKEKTAVNSPMLKVQFFEKAIDCVDAIQHVQGEVQKRISQVEVELREISSNYAGDKNLDKLQQAAAALGFLERWNAQLQERAAALTF